MVKIKKILILLFFIVISFQLSACSEISNKTNCLNMNLGFEPESLDWNQVSDAYSPTIISQIMDGLTSFDEKDGEITVKPALAKSWTINSDGTEYTFHLDPRAKWSDGEPVIAEHFIDSFTRALNPETASPYGDLLSVIDLNKSKALDNETLLIKLKFPANYFLFLTAQCFTYPIRKDLIAKYGDNWTEAENMVTTGRFRLDKWQHEYKILLKAVPDYYLQDEIKSNITELKFFMVPEQSSAFTLFKKGQFDWIDGGSVPSSEFSKLDSLNPQRSSLLRSTFLGFNVQKAPFNNPLLRKAFSYAIDRKELVKLRGRGDVATASWIPPGLKSFYNESRGLEYRPDEARALLKAAGYENGKNFPEVEYLYPSREDAKALAEIMHSMWKKELNINVKLVALEWKVFLKTLTDNPPHLYRMSWGADYPEPSTFMYLFNKKSAINHGRWSNPRYEELVKSAVQSLNKEESIRLYQEAEEILLDEETAIAPLFVNSQVLLKHENIHNISPNPLDILFLEKVVKR